MNIINKQLVFFNSADGGVKIDVKFELETVWLSLNQISGLFG